MRQVTWSNNSDFFYLQFCKLSYSNITCITILVSDTSYIEALIPISTQDSH